MRIFRDGAGDAWEIELTVSTVARVRDLAGVDLLEPAVNPESNVFTEQLNNLETLGAVIRALCEPQAVARGLSPVSYTHLTLPTLYSV